MTFGEEVPGRVGSDPVEESGDSVKVMSFNIRYGLADDGDDSWGKRARLVANTIHDYGPDLLGTQECLLFQGDFLRAVLPGFGFVGVGRDDGDEQGEMCAVFFRSELFEQIDAGHFWLSDEPGQIASVGWDAALTRMATWVKLRTRGPEPITFIFANTHFDHRGQTARRESARVIQKQLEKIAGGLPIILTGDFNAPADSQVDGPYQVLTVEHQWLDTYRQLHQHNTLEGTFNFFRGEKSGARIDWILTSPGLKALAAGIDHANREGQFPSDHFPVTATIVLGP